MSKPGRYRLDGKMYADENGDHVSYREYEALQTEINGLLEAGRALVEALKEVTNNGAKAKDEKWNCILAALKGPAKVFQYGK